MRIIFLGTPEFAVPTLEKLIDWPHGQVVGLLCQPDRPAGRGHKLLPPPTKLLAEKHGIPVFQPERLSKSPETVEAMRALQPDVLVTAAFGQILKEPVLKMATHGVVNVHGSLLPKYRGAAPINWAIINGERETGITTMFSDTGIDTGKMLLKRSVPLDLETNAEQLANTLSQVGAELLVETLDKIRNGTIEPEAQDDSLASYAPMLKKEMGRIDWSKSAMDIHNLVRGLYPWPGGYTQFAGAPLKVLRTLPASDYVASGAKGGQVVTTGKRIIVACGADGESGLELLDVQPANKARMSASAWANGVRLAAGATFETQVVT